MLYRLYLLAVITITLTLPETTRSTKITQITNGNETFSITDSQFFDLKKNLYREGLEVIYRASNLFIDKALLPQITKETLGEIVSLVSKNGKNNSNFNDNDWKEFIKLPYKIYPSLLYFTIVVFVLAFLIFVTGFITCCYRTCCKSKVSPYDRKRDGCKRKFYAIVLFVLLLLLLSASIILFFSNQNSSHAVQRLPKVLGKLRSDINEFNDNEMPVFYASIITNLKLNEIEKNNLINEITEKNLNEFFEVVNESDLFKSLKNDINTIKGLAFRSKTLEVLANQTNDIDLDIYINKYKDQLKEQIKNINLDKFSESINSTVDSIKQMANKGLEILNEDITPKVNKYWSIFSIYYDYFYFSLMVISVFILFLFLIYAFGLAGICARRSQAQCCERSKLARLLLSGVVFFFLFSWLILIFSVTLYVPGVTFRHLICKPAIELENNQIVQNLIGDYTNDSIKFTKMLRECDTFGRSNEIKLAFDSKLKNIIQNEFVVSNIFPVNVQTSLNSFLNDLIDSLKNLDQEIGIVQSQLPDADKLIATEIKEQIVLLIDRLINNVDGQNQSEDYKNLVNNLDAAKVQITSDSLEQLLVIVSKKTDKIMQEIPSCNIFSAAYKETISVSCFEYLDNFNAYWLILIISVLINIIIAFFAIKQSDLFRKFYAYDEMDHENHSKDAKMYSKLGKKQQKGRRMKHPIESDSAIDAFEMESHPKYLNHNNYDKSQNRHHRLQDTRGTPPPQYYK